VKYLALKRHCALVDAEAALVLSNTLSYMSTLNSAMPDLHRPLRGGYVWPVFGPSPSAEPDLTMILDGGQRVNRHVRMWPSN
jgi:hypothetical protein